MSDFGPLMRISNPVALYALTRRVPCGQSDLRLNSSRRRAGALLLDPWSIGVLLKPGAMHPRHRTLYDPLRACRNLDVGFRLQHHQIGRHYHSLNPAYEPVF